MPTYRYRARDRQGRLVSGAAIFDGEEEARAFLRANRLMALEIRPERPEGQIRLGWLRRFQKIDLVPVVRQLAIMLKTGVPLDRAFDVLLDQDYHPRVTEALRQATRDVRAGASLSEALERHPTVFPEMLVALTRAGESGGVLDTSLEEAGRQMVWQRELHQKVVTALSYPTFVFTMALVMVSVMITFVVPSFVKIYAMSKVPLPLPTHVLLTVSVFVRTHGLLIPLVLGALIWGFRKYAQSPTGRRKLDQFRLRLPLLGMTMRKVAIANFCRTLALLLDAGVPILEALRVSANASGSVTIQDAVLGVSEEVTRGHLLALPLQRCGQFPALVTRMVSVGEMTGVLPDVLREIVNVYTVEVDEEIKRAVNLMEPVMVIVVASIVGSLLVALYMPILNISRVATGT